MVCMNYGQNMKEILIGLFSYLTIIKWWYCSMDSIKKTGRHLEKK